MRGLHASLAARGAHYFSGARVDDIRPWTGGRLVVHSRRGRIAAEKVVIAAGHGTGALAATVGIDAPVRPDHGQILVTERTAPWLNHPTLNVRQTDEGSLLLGGSEAERGFDTSALVRTSRDIARRAVRVFPRLGGLRVVRSWARSG